MLDSLDQALEFAKPHWPGFLWSFIAMMVGQINAHRIFTMEQARIKRKSQPFWWWMRKTLPLHPVIAGMIVGVLWQNPEHADPPWPLVGSMMYFAFFGCLSIWLYQLLKGLAEKKGIELDEVDIVPGDSTPPGR